MFSLKSNVTTADGMVILKYRADRIAMCHSQNDYIVCHIDDTGYPTVGSSRRFGLFRNAMRDYNDR